MKFLERIYVDLPLVINKIISFIKAWLKLSVYELKKRRRNFKEKIGDLETWQRANNERHERGMQKLQRTERPEIGERHVKWLVNNRAVLRACKKRLDAIDKYKFEYAVAKPIYNDWAQINAKGLHQI